MTTPVINKFGQVVGSGEGVGDLTDGTASIYVKSVRVSNLSASRPVLTDPTASLVSGNILISQVDGLAAALAGTNSNPLTADLEANQFALTDAKYLGLFNNAGLGDVLINNSLFVAANIPRFRASTGQAFNVITSAGGDAQFYKGATMGVGPVGVPAYYNFPRVLPGDFGTANNYLLLNAGNGDMTWGNAPNQGLSTTDSPAFVNTTITGALLSPDTLTTLTITDTGVRAFSDSQVLASFRHDGSEIVSYDQENTISAFSTSSGNSEIVLSHDNGNIAERSLLTLDSVGIAGEFGGVVRLEIGGDTTIRDAAGVERLTTSGNYTSLRAGTGVNDRFDIDGTGAYIAVQGNPVFWAQAAGNSTRIWCPSTTNFLNIDGSGVGISGSYYLPTADGTAGQRMITNGAGALSFVNNDRLTAPDGNATIQAGDGGVNVIYNVSTGSSVFSSSISAGSTGISSPNAAATMVINDAGDAVVVSTADVALTFPGVLKLNAYSIPGTLGTVGQVLTSNGAAAAQWQTLPSPGLFSQTGTRTVALSVAETSMIQPLGAIGAFSIPAGITAGYSVLIRLGGTFRTNGAGQTLRWRFRVSGVAVLDTGVTTMANINPARAWTAEIQATYNGSQIVSNFRMSYTSGANACIAYHTQTSAVYAPIFHALDISSQWGALSANNTISSTWAIMSRQF